MNKPVTTELAPYVSHVPVPMAQAPERMEMGQLVHRALRGRWGRTIVLAVAGIILGGWAGWKSQKPEFRSEGLLRIAYSLRPVRTDTDITAPLGGIFETYLQSQANTMSSRRLVDLAMREPEWQATGLGTSSAAAERFVQALKVEPVPRTEHLKVQFMDKDPVVAAAGVRSLIRAYESVYKSDDNQTEQARMRTLEEKVKELRGKLDTKNQQVQLIAGDLGPANLEVVVTAAVQQTLRLESQLDDTRLAMALARKSTLGGGEAVALTVKQIEMADPAMRGLVAERDRANERLAAMKLTWGDSHPNVVAAKASLEVAESKVRQYAVDYSDFQKTFGRTHAAGMTPTVTLVGRSLEDLKEEEAVIQKEYAAAKKRMVALGEQRSQIVQLQHDSDQIRNELTEMSGRLEVLRMEATVGGRLKVVSNGEVPIAPYLDKRPRMAAVGGVLGGMMPVGVILLVGLLNRRYRYSDETEDHVARSVPLLGILPRLREHSSDREQESAAAHTVHQIRAMLQVGKSFEGLRTYLVTSSTAGEGKTSLTVALGMAFTSAGLRTLVIDGDFVGQRVSRGFKMEKLPGLREVSTTSTLRECVQTVKGGLSVLPVGSGALLHACSVTPRSIRSVLTAARDAYDVVLIDTGPVLGSVEATVIAPEVDGVLFTIARGQERPLVDRSLQQLNVVGAKVAGFIFNLAESKDWRRSTHGSSMRSVNGSGTVVGGSQPADPDCDFGPLVRAVTSSLPALN